MKKRMFSSVVFILVTLISYGQKKIVIDGDKLHLRDSLGGKIILLSSIERGEQNPNAVWVTYDKRPGVDPWGKDSDESFTKYWKKNGIDILGVSSTYDNCLCFKTKTASSPDMYLLHFKISINDWTKMKEHYPDMVQYVKHID
jgi:hypothetical protein